MGHFRVRGLRVQGLQGFEIQGWWGLVQIHRNRPLGELPRWICCMFWTVPSYVLHVSLGTVLYVLDLPCFECFGLSRGTRGHGTCVILLAGCLDYFTSQKAGTVGRLDTTSFEQTFLLLCTAEFSIFSFTHLEKNFPEVPGSFTGLPSAHFAGHHHCTQLAASLGNFWFGALFPCAVWVGIPFSASICTGYFRNPSQELPMRARAARGKHNRVLRSLLI